MAGRLLAVPSSKLARLYGWIFLAAPILLRIGPKVRMEALVTPPNRMVVRETPAIQISSAPWEVCPILLSNILSAIRASIPESFKTPMIQIGRASCRERV